jgi:hypothetical protein
MTWEFHSPDLPFLNGITIVQAKRGFFEHCLAYAPFFSAICALIGTGAALWIAAQARKISNEQKIIAQNKLEFDLFDRRNEILSTHLNCFLKISHNEFETEESVDKIMSELYDIQLLAVFLFKKPYLDYIVEVRKAISSMADMKIRIINKVNSEKDLENFNKIKLDTATYINKINVSMRAYTPDFISNKTPISTTSPASPDTPQPAAPEADQSPPTP